MTTHTERILAKNVLRSNNTWETGLNNNDLIIGPSGAGKTRGYVKPNLMQANESMIITDTKGNLRREYSRYLQYRGYKVYDIDFTDLIHSPGGYNPLRFIGYDPARDEYNKQDIMKVSRCICPLQTKDDPFWENSAKMYLECLISYVLECLPAKEQTLDTVEQLFRMMDEKRFDQLFQELALINPNGFTMRRFQVIRSNRPADRTHACIKAFLGERLNNLTPDGCEKFYGSRSKVDFREMGKRKTVVFLTVSDSDRSMDPLVNLFYTQAIQELLHSADRDYEDNRLPVPVRLILDDFATNTLIPDFDNIISVIRSREIYTSIVIQSISQLEGLYGMSKSQTILNNCDNWLYLGGQDVSTANCLSVKLDKPVHQVLNMELGKALLFTRGTEPGWVEKYDCGTHPAAELVEKLNKMSPKEFAKEKAREREKNIAENAEKVNTEKETEVL